MDSDGEAVKQRIKDMEYDKMSDKQKRYAQIMAGVKDERRRGLSFHSLTDKEKQEGYKANVQSKKRAF